MNFTTITNLVQRGKKEFESRSYKTVLSNNKSVGMILGAEFAEALEQNGVLAQVQEELWEAHDKETVNAVLAYRAGKKPDISLAEYRKKHDL